MYTEFLHYFSCIRFPPICRFHDRPPFATFPFTFPSFFSPLSPGWIGLISNMQYQYMRLLMLCKFYIFHYCIINMVLSVSYQILATLQYWILKKPSPLLWTKRVIYFLCTVCLEWLDSVQCVIYIYNIIYVVYKLFLYQITFYFFKYILCGSWFFFFFWRMWIKGMWGLLLYTYYLHSTSTRPRMREIVELCQLGPNKLNWD